MDQKAVVRLEVEKDGNLFAFEMPIGAPFGLAYDAAFEALKEITEMSQKATTNAERPTKIKTDDDKEEVKEVEVVEEA